MDEELLVNTKIESGKLANYPEYGSTISGLDVLDAVEYDCLMEATPTNIIDAEPALSLTLKAFKSKKDVEEIELNIQEKESYNLIKELVDDKNLVSKYSLEGHLLYGDLKLSNFKVYHIILSLENKNLLKPIKKDDGDYYLLVG